MDDLISVRVKYQILCFLNMPQEKTCFNKRNDKLAVSAITAPSTPLFKIHSHPIPATEVLSCNYLRDIDLNDYR